MHPVQLAAVFLPFHLMKGNFVLLGNAPIKFSDFSEYFEVHVGALRAQGPR